MTPQNINFRLLSFGTIRRSTILRELDAARGGGASRQEGPSSNAPTSHLSLRSEAAPRKVHADTLGVMVSNDLLGWPI